jgi:chaperonin cofactor prefoldin
MINILDALNIVERTLKDKILTLQANIERQEEYIASLRKNVNKKTKENEENILFRMENKCDEFETKLAQFQIYREKVNALIEIKETINKACKTREDIFNSIGNNAKILDVYVEAAQRDGYVSIS